MGNKKIIQKAKVKSQKYKLKLKSKAKELLTSVHPLADRIIPVAVIPELNSGQALTKVRI